MARKFKNILIDSRFQFRLLSYFIGLFFLTTLSLYSTTYLFFWRMKTKAIKVGIPDGHVFFKFLENQKHDLDLIFIGLAFVNLFLLVGIGLIISHRIAGPIYKIKMFLSKSLTEQGEFRLRNNDFFKDLEPVINKLRERK